MQINGPRHCNARTCLTHLFGQGLDDQRCVPPCPILPNSFIGSIGSIGSISLNADSDRALGVVDAGKSDASFLRTRYPVKRTRSAYLSASQG